jgi:hypothetical protein
MPGSGLLGPGISPQHELLSLVAASSKTITSSRHGDVKARDGKWTGGAAEG